MTFREQQKIHTFSYINGMPLHRAEKMLFECVILAIYLVHLGYPHSIWFFHPLLCMSLPPWSRNKIVHVVIQNP